MARQGWGRHSTVATGSNDSSKQISVNAWNADTNTAGILGFAPETIASASSITPTNSFIKLSGSTNIDTIALGNSAEGDLLYVITTGSVTLANTSSPSSDGQIRLLGNANKDLSTTTPTILIRVGNYWYEYGGSPVTDGSITFAKIQDIATMKVIGRTASGSGDSSEVTILDSDTMSGASDTTLATSESIKTYVDTQVATVPVGDITAVTAGTALTGGGSSGDVTVNADVGIGSDKLLQANANVADNDFLRIDGTKVEGRTAAETLSDVGAAPAAGSSNIVTTGALDSGSITSGFGNINIGSSTITTTGAVATGAITAGGTITGNLTGDVTGDVSGSSGSTTGNAATATALATARTIGGTSFDGTANIAVALSAEATTLATGRTISTTGEVTVTTGAFDGSAAVTGAAVVADNVIDEANLKASNAPTNGYVLTARSGNTGGMTWEASSGGAVELGQYKYQANGYTEPSYSSRTVNDATTPVELWVKDIDGSGNNQAVYIRIKKNGSYTNVQVA